MPLSVDAWHRPYISLQRFAQLWSNRRVLKKWQSKLHSECTRLLFQLLTPGPSRLLGTPIVQAAPRQMSAPMVDTRPLAFASSDSSRNKVTFTAIHCARHRPMEGGLGS